ncbi:MAG: SagB/ThcOx family dehydrogenase, partial [Planctomycetota bacterium JB042]
TGPEAEHVDLLLSVGPAGRATPAVRLDANAVDALLRGDDLGTRSALSRDHHDWPVIEEVAEASRRDGALAGRPDPEPAGEPSASVGPAPSGPGRELLRRRRSAVAMDGRTPLARDAFLRMIGRLRPDPESTPWTAFPGRPAVHPFLFVHRVEGLASGLYVLVRDPAALDPLRAACAARFAWAPVDEALPSLLLLEEGDVRSIARSASCGQEIASDGAFAAAMVAEFAPRLRADGAWRYRALHWEAGAIGQVLYLEAEAAGVRATGIGCFFDDLTHGALGLRGDDHQVVYHFTVGGPVDDPRLVTRPAYP